MKRLFWRIWNVLVVLLLVFVVVESVQALTKSNLAHVQIRMSQVAGRSFDIKIDQDEDLNAWAEADGSLGITSGMLSVLSTEDELAFVLGHEIAHVLGRHHQKQAKHNVLGALGGLLLAKALGAKERSDYELGAQIGAGLVGGKRSRQDEYQADAEAIRLMTKAGYNPEASLSVLRRLQKLYGNGDAHIPVIGWFASHPDTGTRIERLAKEVKNFQSQANSNACHSSASGLKAIVVLDPEASYSSSFGFGRGYYYREELSRIAKQEAEAELEKKGFQVLVSTNDVGPLQEELELENSKWGRYGEGRNPIGYFSGADFVFYVSAYVQGEQGYELGSWRKQVWVSGLKVGVMLRQIELKTRRQLHTLKGSGSVAAISRARVVPRGWDSIEVEFEQEDNLARRAIGEAVRAAVAGVNLNRPVESYENQAEEWVAPEPAESGISL